MELANARAAALVLLVAACCSTAGLGQERALPGHAATLPELTPRMPEGPERWSAYWITAPDAVTGENLMLLARRSFHLPQVPEQARIFITADTRYQLFVNGTFVQRGPARCAAHHQSYDAIDIRRWLRAGANTLAVRVHHTGLGLSYHQPPRCGLLAQLEISHSSGRTTIGTDRHWKTARDPAWDMGSPRVNRSHDAFVDIVDLRKDMGSWASPAFDDTMWLDAVAIIPGRVKPAMNDEVIPSFQWWPKPQPDYLPQAVVPPWVALIPRDIPFLKESVVQARRLAGCGVLRETANIPSPDAARERYRFTAMPLLELPPINRAEEDWPGMEGVDAYTQNQSPLILRPAPAGHSSFIVFDFGEVHNGHPRLEMTGPAGAVVDVLCAPYLLDGILNPRILNSIHADRIILSGRRDRWEAFFFKPARFLAVVIRGAAEPVRLHFAGVTRVEYPWTRRGEFAAPANPWLEAFWRAGAKTVEVITTDAYTDNYRERRQYPQTSYYAARGNYAAFGDTFLQRRYLLQNAQEQEPDGLLPGYAPIAVPPFMPFLDANFFWVMGWRDYLLHSGDFATTRRLLPAARRVMQRLAVMCGPDALLTDPPVPYWIDHSPLDRRGANFVVNALYALTLEGCGETLGWLGEPDRDECRHQAAALRAALRDCFWDARRGLFVDALVEGRQSARYSEHANGLALAAQIATPAQAQSILAELRKPGSDLVPVTSLFVYWTFVGLCVHGHVDEALEVLQTRFDHQLRNGNGTLWEEWHLDRTFRKGVLEKTTRADAQGECGVFPMALTHWAAGIEPVAPGLTEVLLRRQPHSLGEVRATLPSPLGDLRVSWSTSNAGSELQTQVPSGMVVKLDLASVNVPDACDLLLDGRNLDRSQLGGRWHVIPEGSHRLFFRRR